LTSAHSLRLWLVAKPEGNGPRAPESQASAAARIEPTVTFPLEEHMPTVYRYALRLARRHDLAEDIAQETLLRGLRHQTNLREPRAVQLWLLRIATNVWNDYLRKSRTEPAALASDPSCPHPSATQILDERENVRLALEAMDSLPPRQRQVLYLATCEQLSHDEVATVLDIDIAAVKSSLSLARKTMRTRLKDVYESVCARPTCETNRRDA